ncbi:putative Pol polyprotein [Cricetulus griseus]|nr:putative Pol polyprotein [Cricetulus griseus]
MLQLVLPRPSSDSTARRSSGFASPRRQQRRRQRNGPHSGRPLCKVISPYPELVALLITKGRKQSKQYFGKDPELLIVPYTMEQFEVYLVRY